MEITRVEPFLDYFERVRERALRVLQAVPPDSLEWGLHHDRTYRMRRFLLVGLLIAAGACAQRSGAASAPQGWPADEARIRAAIQSSADAWNRGDLPGHLDIYVDTVTFMTRTGPRPGVEPLEQAFSETYFRDGRPIQTLGFEQVVIRPLGRDAALQTGRYLLSGGGEPERSGWFTLVWLRTAEGWRAVHDHSS